MAFKQASDLAQKKARRPLLRDFGFPDEEITDEEYVALVKELVRKCESKIVHLKKGTQERRHLGIQKQILSRELFHLSGKRGKPGKTLANCFMDVAKRELPREEFELLIGLALIEQEKLFEEKQR